MNRDQVLDTTTAYVQLLAALSGQRAGANANANESSGNLRRSGTFTWRNIFGETRQHTITDVTFEMISVLFDQAVWLIGYAQWLIDSLPRLKAESEPQRKLAYDSLLRVCSRSTATL